MKKKRGIVSSKKRGDNDHSKPTKKQRVFPLLGEEVRSVSPLLYSDKVESSLKKVSFFVRGFGRRHLIRLTKYMKEEGLSGDFIYHIKLSFCKFKAMQMIFPEQKKDLIWIFKNLLCLEGQKVFNDTLDACLDINEARALHYYNSLKEPLHVTLWRQRLLRYFFSNDSREWLPLTTFPPILFEKRKMKYAYYPLKEIDEKKYRELFFSFIMSLEVKNLFIPPADILWKVGNQLYNDDGQVRKDYERTSNWRSGFKYQYFLAQPLSPREVWLPDKFIKNNNLFWMTIGRQFLKNCRAYPSPDIRETWERIRGSLEEGCLRFDISGFGFQFPRNLLSLMTSVIQELYPCDQMDICASDLYSILDSVKVEKGYDILYPPRGVGLGYYEDLKTLIILAILDKYDPISVYGDQGILKPFSFEAISDLQESNFIFENDKVEYQSFDRDGGMKWAGGGMFPDVLREAKTISNPLLGCLFSRFHWERKAAMYSFYEDNASFYKRIYKKILRIYDQLYGYEFYLGDLQLSFVDGGINPFSGITIGTSKSFIITRFLRPYEDTLFDAPFVTPFKKRSAKSYPHGLAKQFQKDRIRAYKAFNPISSEVFFYGEPRLSFENKYVPKERIVPDWADLLFLCEYGATTGNFFYGLDQERLSTIASEWSLSIDPLRAAARGGYKILDSTYSKNHPLGREWSLVCEFLEGSSKRRLPYMPRVDLGLPPPIFGSDEMYKDTDLFQHVMNDRSLKRPRSIAFSESSLTRMIKKNLRENVNSNIHNGIINSIANIVTVVDNELDEQQDYAADYEDFVSEDEI